MLIDRPPTAGHTQASSKPAPQQAASRKRPAEQPAEGDTLRPRPVKTTVTSVERQFIRQAERVPPQQILHEGSVREHFAKGRREIQQVESLKIEAKSGNIGALIKLAVAHSRGIGTPVNKLKSKHYFKKAADQGHPGAQTAFAVHRIAGIGGVHRNNEAGIYLHRAMVQNYIPALDITARIAEGAYGGRIDLNIGDYHRARIKYLQSEQS